MEQGLSPGISAGIVTSSLIGGLGAPCIGSAFTISSITGLYSIDDVVLGTGEEGLYTGLGV